MADGELRYSLQTLRVLSVFRHGEALHGLAVCRETGLGVGTVYPLLHKAARIGLLSEQRERVDPSLSSRVPRITYQMTPSGMDQIRAIRELVST